MNFVSTLPRSALILAVICAIAALCAGPGYRFGWWSLGVGFAVLRWAAYGAILATVLAIAGIVVSRRAATRASIGSAIVALVIGVVTFGIPVMMAMKAKELPAIHDITTDTTDPPRFIAVLPLRKDARNPPDYGGTQIAAQQRSAYPEIAPLYSNAPPDKAFSRALDTARSMGWDIVAAVPAEGRIEATDTTLLFGFKDDIVIRVNPAPQGTRIDVRSESRIGKSDVGTNARRVAAFLAKLTKES